VTADGGCMSAWLDPVRQALAANASPITIFFRDDDAGWEDEQLYRLLDVVAPFQAPLALAAIPMAIGARLAAELGRLVASGSPPVSVHQHGYAHVNHEPSGRRFEFGASRSRDLQREDLANGKERLQHAFGRTLPPIFTPPWNRCTGETAECLVELGFEVLSRDVSAEPFRLAPLHELPVSLDWSSRHGARTGAVHWGETIARTIAAGRTIGVLLHHAVMTADDRRMLSELLRVFVAERSNATVCPMPDIARAPHSSRGRPSCVS
jgi:predicted deacetylase